MIDRLVFLRALTVLVLTGVLRMMAVPAPAEAQHSKSLPPIANPTSVATADLDGDGDPDALSASFDDDKIAWYENKGAGQFGPQRTITTRAYGARGVATADLDGDGDADVLSASQEEAAIAWYENDGSATFSGPKTITARTARFWDVATTDVDGDGDPDVVAVSLGEVLWFENQLDAPGTERDFSPPRVLDIEAGRAVSVHTDDLDGDGRSDLLLAGRDGTVAWCKNTSTGTFSSARVIADAGRSTSVWTADLNDDGAPDVLFTSDGTGDIRGGTGAAWTENQIQDRGGAGSQDDFGAPQPVARNAYGATSMFAEDLDGDGAPDLLAAFESDHTISWYRNEKETEFAKPQVLTAGFSGRSLSDYKISDLDGDGDPDVLVATGASRGPTRVVWYENDGTGAFHFASVLARDVSGSRDGAVFTMADLDGDGDRDVVIGAGQKLLWCERRGEGGFTAPNVIASLGGVSGIVAVDRDGDGDEDLLAVSSGANAMTWVENTAEGFSVSTERRVGPGLLQTVRSADLDGDGDQDLLVSIAPPPTHGRCGGARAADCAGGLTTPSPPDTTQSEPGADTVASEGAKDAAESERRESPSAGLSWYENTDSTFTRHPISDRSSGTLHATDIDGDGDLDLIADEHWYANDGKGTFSARAYASADGDGEISCCAAVDDMNGDGDPDLLVEQSEGLEWYTNDGTGTFSGPVTLTRIHDPPTPRATADVNGDGRVDVFATHKAPGASLVLLTWYVQTDTGVEVDPKVDPPGDPGDVDATIRDGTVALRWGASEADDLRGYLIERTRQRGTAAPAGSADKWASTTTSGTSAETTTYTDEDVRDGNTYFYRVKAMDHDLNRSRPSAEVKVHVPSDGN